MHEALSVQYQPFLEAVFLDQELIEGFTKEKEKDGEIKEKNLIFSVHK